MQNSSAAADSRLPVSGNRLPQPFPNGNFVINLSASTTPVALVNPSHPDLKGFSFFVSRRREDRRERFRLHMGYFKTQEDAEKLLDVVREIFPAAWAGVAPGQRLRAATAPQTPLRPAGHELPHIEVPSPTVTLKAIAELQLEPPAAMPEPARAALPTLAPPVPTSVRVEQVERLAAAQSLDSVRAAIASLDDNSRQSSTSDHPVLRPPAELRLLSDSQTMKLLEKSAAPGTANPAAAGRAELAAFAVQLKWSVQPIDASNLPGLAILDAYTLYAAEGNRDGRRWYALRLGFFSDSASAKQVAHYVRSEFDSVTVVPITGGERDRALQAANQLTRSEPVTTAPRKSGEIRLIEEAPALKADKPAVASAPASARAPVKPASKVRRPPMSLEETLEVLGANDLQMDNKRSELLAGSAAKSMRHAAKRAAPQRSALGKLFERLAGMSQ